MSNHQSTLFLSFTDIKEIIHRVGINQLMDDMIFDIESAFKNFDNTQITTPKRSGFNYEKPHVGLVEWMPLLKVEDEIMLKIVGYHPENPNIYNLPTILSSLTNYDINTGRLKSIMDGTFTTAMRTGAASAVATKYMALPESNILGLIGCGAQAITQFHALSRIYPFENVLIFDTDRETLNSFEERCEALHINVKITPSTIHDILEQSDIISTATSIGVGEGPLFEATHTKPHLHINAVGSDFPGKIELPLSFLQQSFVCPDYKEQAFIEGECQQLAESDVTEDIVGLINNKEKYNYLKETTTVFDSTGWAIEDYIAQKIIIKYAQEFQLGKYVDVEYKPKDSKNPYHFLNENMIADISK